jgi:hypothetical protein
MTNSDEVVLPRYTLTDDGNFLRLRWAPGITIEAQDVHSAVAAGKSAAPGGKRPLLVHIGLVQRITVEAKQLLLDQTGATRTAIVGVDEVSRVLTAFNHRSATPTRYFTEESEAIAWLLEDAETDTDPNGPSALATSFTAAMRGEVLWVAFDTSADVTNTVAAALLRQVNRLSPDSCPPMLIHLNDLVTITDEALHALASGLNVAALAVVGNEPGDLIVAAYYKQQHRPPYPTKHFRTTTDAQRWLVSCFRQGD